MIVSSKLKFIFGISRILAIKIIVLYQIYRHSISAIISLISLKWPVCLFVKVFVCTVFWHKRLRGIFLMKHLFSALGLDLPASSLMYFHVFLKAIIGMLEWPSG